MGLFFSRLSGITQQETLRESKCLHEKYPKPFPPEKVISLEYALPRSSR